MKTLVFIPTYNERENIRELIKEIMGTNLDIGILVVDDDSPDETWRIVKEISSKNKGVRLLHRKKDKGRGRAGIAAFKYAIENKYDFIIEMDADFSHQVRYIPEFLKEIKNNDVVIGSRFVKGGIDTRKGYIRETITTLANLYLRFIFFIKTRDCTSGYRCFRIDTLKKINLDKIYTMGKTYVTEGYILLALLNKKRYKIKEIPIIFEDRSKGRSNLRLSTIVKAFISVNLFWFKYHFTNLKKFYR